MLPPTLSGTHISLGITGAVIAWPGGFCLLGPGELHLLAGAGWNLGHGPPGGEGGGGSAGGPPGSVDSPPWGNCCCNKVLAVTRHCLTFTNFFFYITPALRKTVDQYYVLLKYCIPMAGYEIPLYICCRSLQAKLVSSSIVNSVKHSNPKSFQWFDGIFPIIIFKRLLAVVYFGFHLSLRMPYFKDSIVFIHDSRLQGGGCLVHWWEAGTLKTLLAVFIILHIEMFFLYI